MLARAQESCSELEVIVNGRAWQHTKKPAPVWSWLLG